MSSCVTSFCANEVIITTSDKWTFDSNMLFLRQPQWYTSASVQIWGQVALHSMCHICRMRYYRERESGTKKNKLFSFSHPFPIYLYHFPLYSSFFYCHLCSFAFFFLTIIIFLLHLSHNTKKGTVVKSGGYEAKIMIKSIVCSVM